MNDIATKARAAAASFECKKHALRQTQNGEWIISFTALDLPTWLVTAHMGTRLLNAVVEIADDETPVDHAKDEVSRETRVEQNSGAPKGDTYHPKNTAASERFRALGKPEQMVSRCAMTTADQQFWKFIEYCGYGAPTKEGEAAQWVRQQLGIKSRSELASDGHAQSVWEQIVTDYDLWRGAIPEQRG